MRAIGVWRWFALVLLALGMTMAVSCKKGGEEGEGGGGEAAEDMTPQELGEAIGQKYIAAMVDLRGLLEGLPASETLRPQLDELFERYVQDLVALGHQRWALSEDERMAVDSALRHVMFSEADQAIGGLQFMTDAMNHYRPMDNELANKISSFNVITQYASFELLQRQAPEEATRLGVPPSE